MKYPSVILKGERQGEVLSIALAGDGQHQDTGAKMIHAADETSSNIIAKSISVGTGRSSYRGIVNVPRNLKGCKNNTECDALLINSNSRLTHIPRFLFMVMEIPCSKLVSPRSALSKSSTCAKEG